MRARAGDPPRTMPQKILAGRAEDPALTGDLVQVKVDQVVLTRKQSTTLREALRGGLSTSAVETTIAYDGHCVTDPKTSAHRFEESLISDLVQRKILVGRAGLGFPPAVHLERFAAPARLALTDDPRLASLGGAGMLTLAASPSQLADALISGKVWVRPMRSVQVLLSGKMRPFICVRDVSFELLRRGLRETVAQVDQASGAPVVLEFAGQSARLLSVAERAVLCSLAPLVGAAGSVFVSDEKTEVFLRDQRRSKAYRALQPDPGAPCDEVVTLDLATVDPLAMTSDGTVRAVREYEGEPVSQAILGGDSGASLRDLLAAAALLKSKRLPATMEFLLAPPSRQVLEVLAQAGSLVDLIASGARVIEPDERLIQAGLYPPPSKARSLRTFDIAGPEQPSSALVVSPETLAYSVATGVVGDPRSFKRPVRVTVPRILPTDDVLIIRKTRNTNASPAENLINSAPEISTAWAGQSQLRIETNGRSLSGPTAFVVSSAAQLRVLARNAADYVPDLRAVIATELPTHLIPVLSGLGILALECSPDQLEMLRKAAQLRVPDLAKLKLDRKLSAQADGTEIQLTWPAVALERDWTLAGTALARDSTRTHTRTSKSDS